MRVWLAAIIVLASSVEPMLAHHSIAAQYDLSKTITIKGTVTLSVTEADGRAVDWEIEMVSPNVLMKTGWTRDAFKPGDQISVDALEAKDGAKLGYARAVTWPDGRILSVPQDLFSDPIPK